MRIAVTGASGHVGANLCPMLVEHGYDVNVLFFRDDRAFKDIRVNIFKGSLTQPETLDAFLTGVDVVINTAAYISVNLNDDRMVYETNVNGTQNLVEKCLRHGVKRLIHFSSIHAFEADPMDQTLDEQRQLVKKSKFIYDQTKADSERIVRAANSAKLETIVLNPTSIIGPRDYKPSLIGRSVVNLYHKKIPALISGGYDFVDVRDVAFAAMQAITKARPGEKYLLSGKWHSIKEFGDFFSKSSGIKRPWFICPMWLAKGSMPFVKPFLSNGIQLLFNKQTIEILQHSHPGISSAKAEKELGFKSRDISESVNDAVQWFKEHKYI